MTLWKSRRASSHTPIARSFVTFVSMAGAVHGFACSPERSDAPSSERDDPDREMEATSDAGAAASEIMRKDAGSADATLAPKGAKNDFATANTAGALDAGRADANRATPSENRPDASDLPEPPADSGAGGANPSAGCMKGSRPSGGRLSVAGDHNFTFPVDYNGKDPLPLLIGFHAAGNPIEQIEDLTKGSELETSYVRAFPKSKGSAWDYATDIGTVLAMYDDLIANHCVDLNRIFATGHSSGAQLIAQILTPAHRADADHLRFKAVAPVAASRYGNVSRAIPILYIQGAHDNVRNSDGSDVVKEFTAANGCQTSSKPYTAVAACSSSGKGVKDGCIQYEGCTVPTVWCSHDDPQYSNTNHGWPCFATKSMSEFFAAVP